MGPLLAYCLLPTAYCPLKPLPMRFISFVEREGAWRKEGRRADARTIRSLSSVLRPAISDIVKRKRIRSRPDGMRAGKGGFKGLPLSVEGLSSDFWRTCPLRLSLFSVVCRPSSGPEHQSWV